MSVRAGPAGNKRRASTCVVTPRRGSVPSFPDAQGVFECLDSIPRLMHELAEAEKAHADICKTRDYLKGCLDDKRDGVRRQYVLWTKRSYGTYRKVQEAKQRLTLAKHKEACVT